jgi:ribosomal protein L7Ae-like RNA K-turn-binding protein
VERVREALRDRQVQCLVVAADASSRTREKVVRLAAARRVPVVAGPPADELGARLGLATVQVVGVLDRALAVGLLEGPGGMAHRED